MSISINKLQFGSGNFPQELRKLAAWEDVVDSSLESTVADILEAVRSGGDGALIEFTNKFDRVAAKTMAELEISKERLDEAVRLIPEAEREALETAANRIRIFHEEQIAHTWFFVDEWGNRLGQQVTAIERVGIYVPGGKASYPSSVLMNTIPARVAGVENIIMVVPAPDGQVNNLVLAAASIAGVDRVFTIGGAQAIAALAYGTETVPAVDKIVGPGNRYVASAKRKVFGRVGIDMVAGPSEILVLCDGKTNPDWIAMDMFAQAEHDEMAQAILVTDSESFIEQVEQSIQRLLTDMSRADIITTALENRAAFILVEDIKQGIDIVNQLAPEHLELSVENAAALLPEIKHAGAIFSGRYTAEAVGDYCAGPNHVLPTSGTSRFSSPLGVYDFQKRSSVIDCSKEGAAELGKIASILANGEGLTAHARSAQYRLDSGDK